MTLINRGLSGPSSNHTVHIHNMHPSPSRHHHYWSPPLNVKSCSAHLSCAQKHLVRHIIRFLNIRVSQFFEVRFEFVARIRWDLDADQDFADVCEIKSAMGSSSSLDGQGRDSTRSEGGERMGGLTDDSKRSPD